MLTGQPARHRLHSAWISSSSDGWFHLHQDAIDTAGICSDQCRLQVFQVFANPGLHSLCCFVLIPQHRQRISKKIVSVSGSCQDSCCVFTYPSDLRSLLSGSHLRNDSHPFHDVPVKMFISHTLLVNRHNFVQQVQGNCGWVLVAPFGNFQPSDPVPPWSKGHDFRSTGCTEDAWPRYPIGSSSQLK